MKLKTNIAKYGLVASIATVGAMVWLQKKRHLNLSNRVVLITGGSRGFGLLLAQEFASRGARVAICARDETELQGGRKYLQMFGFDATTFVCDVTDKAQIEQLISDVQAQMGDIEVLVNNAGVLQMGPMESMTDADMHASLDTHVWAVWHAVNAVLPSMKRRKSGRILNICSIGGRVNAPHLLPYTTGKFALAGLSQSLRIELAQHGVLVTTAYPFAMRVGSLVNAQMKGQHRKEYALINIANSNPLMSMSGERAARNVVEALIRGDSVIIPSNRAQLSVAAAGVFPGLMLEATSLIARFLPSPNGAESVGTTGALGRDSTSSLSPSILTQANDRKSGELNEL